MLLTGRDSRGRFPDYLLAKFKCGSKTGRCSCDRGTSFSQPMVFFWFLSMLDANRNSGEPRLSVSRRMTEIE